MQYEDKMSIAFKEQLEYSNSCPIKERKGKKASKIIFSDIQLKILESCRSAVTRDSKAYYRQVQKLFLGQMKKKHIKGQFKDKEPPKKSFKALCQKIQQLQNAEKGFEIKEPWDQKLVSKMLDSVSKGMQWIDIQNLPEFKEKGLSNNKIKNKFQADIRYKFGVIFRKYTKKGERQQLNLSGVVLICFLDQDRMRKTFSQYLKEEQVNSIINLRGYFMKSLQGQNLGRRSKKREKKAEETLNQIEDSVKHMFLQAVRLIKSTQEFQTKRRDKKQSQLRLEDLHASKKQQENKREIINQQVKDHFDDEFSEQLNYESQQQFKVGDIVQEIWKEGNNIKLRKSLSAPQIEFEKYSTSFFLTYSNEEQRSVEKGQATEENERWAIQNQHFDQQCLSYK